MKLTNQNFGFHGIELTLLQLDSWSPGLGFITNYILNYKKDKVGFRHKKRFNTV